MLSSQAVMSQANGAEGFYCLGINLIPDRGGGKAYPLSTTKQQIASQTTERVTTFPTRFAGRGMTGNCYPCKYLSVNYSISGLILL